MDTKNSLYNELIIKINNTRLEYDKAIKLINDKGVINLKNINPMNYLNEGLYNIKEYCKDYDYNFFQEECFAKYIIISYIEGVIDELNGCFNNMLKYSDANIFDRIRYKKLLDNTFDLYTTNIISLQLFDLGYFMEYFYMMLQVDGYFNSFLPGMFYKYLALITSDMYKIGIDMTKDEMYDNVLALIDSKERLLEENNELINKEQSYEILKNMTLKYRTDFISINEDYSFEKVYSNGNKKRTYK